MILFIVFLIPLIGTTIGAILVFFIKHDFIKKVEKLFAGLAAGVMLASSIWSLIIPSLELSEGYNSLKFLPSTIGFSLGIIIMMLSDKILENKDINKMNFAVVIHNIPEGLAVGIALAAALTNNSLLLSEAIILAFGIAVQNIPEGGIVSLNLNTKHSKLKSFFQGFLSGVVEPLASLLAFISVAYVSPLMPYFLSFAAGAMIFVVVSELIPNSKSNICTFGILIGFNIMMILDVML